MDLRETSLLESDQASHWYYRSKFALLRKMTEGVTRASVLDVGAGTGIFSRQLLESTDCREATCVDIGYTEHRTEYVNGRPLRFCRSKDGAKPDIVLFMDVLEHVEDDVALLADYVTDMPAGTTFFITVPAFNWLWSGHDVFLGHYRRYTLPQLERVAKRTGLDIVRGGYFLGLLLPIVALTRLGERCFARSKAPQSQLQSHGLFLNRILLALSLADLKFLGRNRLGGVTAYVLAVKS